MCSEYHEYGITYTHSSCAIFKGGKFIMEFSTFGEAQEWIDNQVGGRLNETENQG